MLLEIRKYAEIELDSDIQHQIALLLQKCFPNIGYKNLHYNHQFPNYRLLAYEDEMLVGHVGVDFRMMTLNNKPVKIFGIIDLCVLEERRHHYIGSFLLEEIEKLAAKINADFILAMCEVGSIFKKHHYKFVDNNCIWLNIQQHKSVEINNEFIQNKIMVKQLSDKKWEIGILDFLGYKY